MAPLGDLRDRYRQDGGLVSGALWRQWCLAGLRAWPGGGTGTTNINFPPADERYIKSKVESGFYSNATEVVRDAIRRMRERDESLHACLMAALEAGEQAIREGHTVPYTTDFLDECEKRARQNLAESKELNPDVLP